MKIFSTILFLIFLACSTIVSNSFAQSKESVSEYLKREKVRAFSYVDVSKNVDHDMQLIKKWGFNFVLAAPGLCDSPLKKVMPLISSADKAGLKIIWTASMANQYSNPALKEVLADDHRRYVGADGRISSGSACPTDTLFWEAVLLHRSLPFASLAAKGYKSNAGLLVDPEDYSGGFNESRYCYCNYCFGDFVKSIGRSNEASMPPEKRYDWLVSNNLLSDYYKYQNKESAEMLNVIRRHMDTIDPDFIFATYPWLHGNLESKDRPVPWDERLAGGLGTTRTPFLIFDEATYSFGYEPRIEAWSNELKEKGLHFAAIPGYNVIPSERIWWPEDAAYNAFYAAKRSSGYWIFVGNWAMLMKNDQRPQQIGGTPEEWRNAFSRLNKIIVQHNFNHPPAEFAQPIPLSPPQKDLPHGYQIPDLNSPKHSSDSHLFIRRWTSIGLPYEGGELVLIDAHKNSWLSFEREVREPDRYEISTWFTLGPDRGIAQLYVDNKPAGKPIDLYSPITLPSQWFVVGHPVLKDRWSRLEFRVTGKNEKSSGYEVGFTQIGVTQVGWWPKEWKVILPFDNTGESQPGYNTVYPPEKEINFDTIYTGKNGIPVSWQTYKTEQDGKFNFIPLVSDIRDEVAYALVYVNCPSDGMRSIRLGTDDGGKLWVNDKFIWGENISRSATRDECRPMTFFHKGWNKILLKITQTNGQWDFFFRIYDPDHQLKYALRPGN